MELHTGSTGPQTGSITSTLTYCPNCGVMIPISQSTTHRCLPKTDPIHELLREILAELRELRHALTAPAKHRRVTK